MISYDFSSLARKWPSSFVSREKVAEFTGGIINPRTLANLDSAGHGIKRFRIGRKVVYRVEDVCEWLAERARDVNDLEG
jgi:phage terminase Nu1 subunit (DNA packaging protein)